LPLVMATASSSLLIINFFPGEKIQKVSSGLGTKCTVTPRAS
jgi:hypothetical protein